MGGHGRQDARTASGAKSQGKEGRERKEKKKEKGTKPDLAPGQTSRAGVTLSYTRWPTSLPAGPGPPLATQDHRWRPRRSRRPTSRTDKQGGGEQPPHLGRAGALASCLTDARSPADGRQTRRERYGAGRPSQPEPPTGRLSVGWRKGRPCGQTDTVTALPLRRSLHTIPLTPREQVARRPPLHIPSELACGDARRAAVPPPQKPQKRGCPAMPGAAGRPP